MKIEKFDRRPFSVMAVQVSFTNFQEVAEWCKGSVVMQKAKMLGVETEVPAVRVEGQGDNRGKSFVASLGCYIVELKGSFRVYKPAQFESSFVKVDPLTSCDECTNSAEHVEHLRRFFKEEAMKVGGELLVEGPDEEELRQGADELPNSTDQVA